MVGGEKTAENTVNTEAKSNDANSVEVGILHSLSGTMAISEVSLKDVLLMAIDEINANGDDCVLNTLNGDSNVPFYKEFTNQKLTADDCPIMAFSIAEDELRSMDTKYLSGHLAAWNYFQYIKSPEN